MITDDQNIDAGYRRQHLVTSYTLAFFCDTKVHQGPDVKGGGAFLPPPPALAKGRTGPALVRVEQIPIEIYCFMSSSLTLETFCSFAKWASTEVLSAMNVPRW